MVKDVVERKGLYKEMRKRGLSTCKMEGCCALYLRKDIEP
jgi:hypothetical protein